MRSPAAGFAPIGGTFAVVSAGARPGVPPRGVVHHSIPLGDEPVKLINNWVVDKGKPLLTPAPQ